MLTHPLAHEVLILRALLASLALAVCLASCGGTHLSASLSEHTTPAGGEEIDACLITTFDAAPGLLSADGQARALAAKKKK